MQMGCVCWKTVVAVVVVSMKMRDNVDAKLLVVDVAVSVVADLVVFTVCSRHVALVVVVGLVVVIVTVVQYVCCCHSCCSCCCCSCCDC